METKPVKQTWKPTVAGIFQILDGAGTIILSFFLLAGTIVMSQAASWAGFNEQDFAPMTLGAVVGLMGLFTFVIAVLGILELIGGILAVQRKNWGMALTGSIAAAIPGNILGILAIIFLSMSKDEFVRGNGIQTTAIAVT